MVNFVTTTYNEIYDISTKTNTATLLGFRAPQSAPARFFAGLYSQFRWVKYLGQRTVVQALAQLPVDPLRVGEGTSDIQQISPKTLANPIMFKGAHGESLNDALNIVYRNNPDKLGDGMTRNDWTLDQDYDYYYSLLSDNTVKKFANQRSFCLPKMYPLVHKLATLHPIYPNGGLGGENTGMFTAADLPDEIVKDVHFDNGGSTTEPTRTPYSSGYQVPTDGNIPQYAFDSHYHAIDTERLNKNLVVEKTRKNDTVSEIDAIRSANPVIQNLEQTKPQFVDNYAVSAGVQRFGWMPTSTFASTYDDGEWEANGLRTYTTFPKMYMGVMILPPTYQDSYKLYYRIYIKHYFQFKGFSTSLTLNPDRLPLPEPGERLHQYEDWTTDKTIMSTNADIDLINAGVK